MTVTEPQISITEEYIEIKFVGNDISPSTVALDDLARELTVLKDLLLPIIKEYFPAHSYEKDILGFYDIGNKSLSYRYFPKVVRDVILGAYSTLVLGIGARDLGLLPPETISALTRVSDFNYKYGSQVQFGVSNGSGADFRPLASFGDEFRKDKLKWVRGYTTVYGKLKFIGGDKPQAKVELSNGSTVLIYLTEAKAKDIGGLIYSNVKIQGKANWVGPTLRMVSIELDKIVPFDRLNAEETFKLLASDLGSKWKNEDIDSYLSE